MNKKELKQKLIDIRNGALITPILEEIWESQDPRDKGMNKYKPEEEK